MLCKNSAIHSKILDVFLICVHNLISIVVFLFSRKSMPLKVRLRLGPRGQEKVNGDKKEEEVDIISEASDSEDGSNIPDLPEGLLQSLIACKM